MGVGNVQAGAACVVSAAGRDGVLRSHYGLFHCTLSGFIFTVYTQRLLHGPGRVQAPVQSEKTVVEWGPLLLCGVWLQLEPFFFSTENVLFFSQPPLSCGALAGERRLLLELFSS